MEILKSGFVCSFFLRIWLIDNSDISRLKVFWDFPDGSEVKVSACDAGDPGSIPGSGRSPGEGNGNPLQYSCLENPMDGGAWWATVHEVAKSQTGLSDFTLTFTLLCIDTKMLVLLKLYNILRYSL